WLECREKLCVRRKPRRFSRLLTDLISCWALAPFFEGSSCARQRMLKTARPRIKVKSPSTLGRGERLQRVRPADISDHCSKPSQQPGEIGHASAYVSRVE